MSCSSDVSFAQRLDCVLETQFSHVQLGFLLLQLGAVEVSDEFLQALAGEEELSEASAANQPVFYPTLG